MIDGFFLKEFGFDPEREDQIAQEPSRFQQTMAPNVNIISPNLPPRH